MDRLHVILFWIAVAVILIIGFIDGNFLGGGSFILINWVFLALVAGNLSYFDKSEKYRLPLIMFLMIQVFIWSALAVHTL